LAGHSVGAAVAYEMAQRLAADGEPVPFLGLLDHAGPEIRLSDWDWLRFHLSVITTLPARERWIYIRRGIHWRVRFLLANRRARKPLPGPGRSAAMGSVYVLEQALRALQNYRIRPYPGKVTLFRARHGTPRIHSDPCGGWRGMAAGGIEVVEVPGSHMTMFEQPYVTALGQAIGRCLDAVSGS